MPIQKPDEIPPEWFRMYCQNSRLPVGCLNSDHRFVWVNEAFEKLVGYTNTELRELKWMDITVSADVAGDLSSAIGLAAGYDSSYVISKRYRHRRGHEIAVELTVWRYPPIGEFICYLIEAFPTMPVSIEVEKVRSEIFEAIDDLRQEFIASHKQVDHPVKQQDSQVVNVGNNSAEAFKWIVFALISLIAGTAYLIYIGGWNHHHGEADPPQLPIIENPAQ